MIFKWKCILQKSIKRIMNDSNFSLTESFSNSINFSAMDRKTLKSFIELFLKSKIT